MKGPQFTLDPHDIENCYPPNGGIAPYDQAIPFITFRSGHLPWERSPFTGAPPELAPWLALVLFAEGEVVVDPATNSSTTTTTVDALLCPKTPNPLILGPDIPIDCGDTTLTSTQLQVVTISVGAFAAMPQLGDLEFLAHRRVVEMPGRKRRDVSSLLCNRLPLSTVAGSSPQGTRYYAHVVSLEGFMNVLGAPPVIPAGVQHVQLISLYNWSFISMPEGGATFAALTAGLVASEAATGGALALPVSPIVPPAPPEVVDRLNAGYVALQMNAFGEQTFSWYRGPFTAAPPAAVPDVGTPAVPVADATAADALLIYVESDGVFDTTYSSAWNLGRGAALADGNFCSALLTWRQQAAFALNLLATRMAMPHLRGREPRELLAHGAPRRAIEEDLVRGDLASRWAHAIESSRGLHVPRARKRHARVSAQELLRRADVVDAIGEYAAGSEADQTISAWLAKLALLENVPFSHLVPDPRMLPVESIRFFFVDANWIAAAGAGALSLAVGTSLDAGIHGALLPQLLGGLSPARVPAAGMLIRSQLISDFPKTDVFATASGAAVEILRDSILAPAVRLCLFAEVPDTITLSEPYHSLRFGIDDDGAAVRAVTGAIGSPTGAYVPSSGGFLEFVATYCTNGVLAVSELAAALGADLGQDLDGGTYAMQVVLAAEQQNFSWGGA